MPSLESRKGRTREEAMARVAATSTTVYIGNLAFVTTDAQILALFGRCGTVERVIMGLNKVTKLPCGFAFIMCVTTLRKGLLRCFRGGAGKAFIASEVRIECFFLTSPRERWCLG